MQNLDAGFLARRRREVLVRREILVRGRHAHAPQSLHGNPSRFANTLLIQPDQTTATPDLFFRALGGSAPGRTTSGPATPAAARAASRPEWPCRTAGPAAPPCPGTAQLYSGAQGRSREEMREGREGMGGTRAPRVGAEWRAPGAERGEAGGEAGRPSLEFVVNPKP